MALYKFDDTNIVKSSAIDVNGYHQDNKNIFVEEIYGINDNSFYMASILNMSEHINEVDAHSVGILAGDMYIYFGDEKDLSDVEFNTENALIRIIDYDVYELIQTVNSTLIKLYKNYYLIRCKPLYATDFPEKWKEMKAHLVLIVNKPDNGYGIIQIHQK